MDTQIEGRAPLGSSSGSFLGQSLVSRFTRLPLRRYALWIALVALVAVLCIVSDSFRSVENLRNILSQQAIIGIVACGMLAMMVSGGFDLSVGAVGAAASVLAAYCSDHIGLGAGIGAAALLGLLMGSVNGVVITRGNINPFIATFAVASVISGVLFVITKGESVIGEAGWLNKLAFDNVFGIPEVFLVFIGFALITHLVLTRSKWGHWLFSVGASANASYLSGVPLRATQVGAFTFGGLAAGLAGVLLFGQTAIGQPSAASSWPLDAIAICIIGGTSLSGGEGRVADVVVATLLLGVVSNGLNQLGVSPYWQPAVTGLIILAAAFVSGFGKGRQSA